ncbi:MAG: nitronate monooxygenase [Deltaproteobacteria bacterium]|nr:MAG: nitronate monooxygenase [Deltaproteobacteria bacterium]
MELPSFKIGNLNFPVPIIQGGMGVGVSLSRLARAVSLCGGLGTISSAGLDRLVSERIGRKVGIREACAIEIEKAKQGMTPIAINIMVALENTYAKSVLGALDAAVDVIISGAGLPVKLPQIVNEHPNGEKTKLIPITSSGRALRLICKRWMKAGRTPDAVIVEGPLAGGHLGWKSLAEIESPDTKLENLVEDCLEVARDFGNFPVIAAGGIYNHEDIHRFLDLGAAGVQMGTRFLATEESEASDNFKDALVRCSEEDIMVATEPGSPCGLPFRILKESPMLKETLSGMRKAICDKGYAMMGGKCLAKELPERFFCICNGLLSSAGYKGTKDEPSLYTVGALAALVDKITSVKELMEELVQGKTSKT